MSGLTALAKTEDMGDAVLASQKRKMEHAEKLLKVALLVDEFISHPGKLYMAVEYPVHIFEKNRQKSWKTL